MRRAVSSSLPLKQPTTSLWARTAESRPLEALASCWVTSAKRSSCSLAVRDVHLHVEVRVLSQSGGLDEILQGELAPAPAVARVAEQLVPLCCLGHQAILLAADPVQQSTQLAERVGYAGITAGVSTQHHDYQSCSACRTQDVADQKTHSPHIGARGAYIEICPTICITPDAPCSQFGARNRPGSADAAELGERHEDDPLDGVERKRCDLDHRCVVVAHLDYSTTGTGRHALDGRGQLDQIRSGDVS
jgi:hypothetical protein